MKRPVTPATNPRLLNIESSLYQSQLFIQPPLHLGGRPSQNLQDWSQGSPGRCRHEDTKPAGTLVQLVRHSGEPQMSDSTRVGQTFHRSGASPQREIDSE